MTKGLNSDLQAVVLVGPGHRLHPFVDDQSIPKALLPVANRPMIYFIISWLVQHGIQDVVVVAHRDASEKLRYYFNSQYDGPAKVDLVVINEYRGTVDALLAAKDRLWGDFVLLPCDLFTDFNLQRMIDMYRMESPACLALLLAKAQVGKGAGEEGPRHRESDYNEDLLVGLDESRSKLLMLHNQADIEDSFSIRLSLMFRFPAMFMRTDLLDPHLYILRRSLLEDVRLFGANQEMFSVREEFIPRLVRRQFKERAEAADCLCMIAELGQTSNIIPVSYCLRANTLRGLQEANRLLLKPTQTILQPLIRISQAAQLEGKCQVGPDCIVGDHSQLGDKTGIKRSVIGNHVVIGTNVKLTGCLIMDHVQVEDGVKLENCIVGPRAKIGNKASLKDCDVGPSVSVEKDSQHKAEVMTADLD